MDERTLNYGTNSREDLYKVLATIWSWSPTYASTPGYSSLSSEGKRGIRISLEHLSDVIIQLAHMSSLGNGQVNPVHRPVVEELMADLQAMLDKMPPQEKPVVYAPGVVVACDEPGEVLDAQQSAEMAGARLARKLIAAGADPLALVALCESMAPDQPQPEPDLSAASAKLGKLLGGEGRKKPKGIFSLYDGV